MAASLLLCRPLQRVRTTVVLRASGRERHFLATKKAQSKGGAAPALKAKSASAPVAKTVAKPVAKAAATKASAKPAPAAAIVVPPTDLQIKLIKTKLSKKELEEYRNLLLAKRRQLFAMLNGMEQEALRSPGGQLSNMPVHMADMGSDVYEQDFTLGMAEAERKILVEIDAALQRIEDKTFGVCQMSGKPISKARLDAKPWAKYTIEAERIIESNGTR